eukprot:6043817-Lingulodinium_polyedra.AAC.1
MVLAAGGVNRKSSKPVSLDAIHPEQRGRTLGWQAQGFLVGALGRSGLQGRAQLRRQERVRLAVDVPGHKRRPTRLAIL